MIYQHKRSGVLYRKLMESFSVERQRPSVTYLRMETGEVFDRDLEKFEEDFLFIQDPQKTIAPRDASLRLPLEKSMADRMVDRFLVWKLPVGFLPDGGISYRPGITAPTGTNLLDASQAREMVEHLLKGEKP